MSTFTSPALERIIVTKDMVHSYLNSANENDLQFLRDIAQWRNEVQSSASSYHITLYGLLNQLHTLVETRKEENTLMNSIFMYQLDDVAFKICQDEPARLRLHGLIDPYAEGTSCSVM